MEDPKATELFHPTRALLDSLELDQMVLTFDEEQSDNPTHQSHFKAALEVLSKMHRHGRMDSCKLSDLTDSEEVREAVLKYEIANLWDAVKAVNLQMSIQKGGGQ